jgi:hypothetical protein
MASPYDLNARQSVEVLTMAQWARLAGTYPPDEEVSIHTQAALKQFLTDNGETVAPTDAVTIVYDEDGDALPVQLTW